MTLFGYLGTAITVAAVGLAYSALGGGLGAAIVAIGILRFLVSATFLVALLAVGFALVEVRESPVRTFPNVATAGGAAFIFFVVHSVRRLFQSTLCVYSPLCCSL
jgi:hypothetical protein